MTYYTSSMRKRLAAKRAGPGHLDRVSGAVFQMHQEIIWLRYERFPFIP